MYFLGRAARQPTLSAAGIRLAESALPGAGRSILWSIGLRKKRIAEIESDANGFFAMPRRGRYRMFLEAAAFVRVAYPEWGHLVSWALPSLKDLLLWPN